MLRICGAEASDSKVSWNSSLYMSRVMAGQSVEAFVLRVRMGVMKEAL
jgi:uncharacterized alpha/beta hydrolase family protein